MQDLPPLPLAGEGWGEGRRQMRSIERGPSSGAAARRKTGVFDALWRHLLLQAGEGDHRRPIPASAQEPASPA